MGWFINFVWWYCYGFVLLFSLLVFSRPSFCQLVTCWRSDLLLLGWLLSCFPNYIRCGCLLICFVFVLLNSIEIDWFINRSIGWIDWLIDRPIDRLIDCSIGCLPTGYGGSFLRSILLVLFYSVPCAHERCDPCAFLLALRGFVELISVMVRCRGSVLLRPPGGDWKIPPLGP